MASRPTLGDLLKFLEPFESDEEREEARQRLLDLGESYQADLDEESAAPRRGDVAAELQQIASAAMGLRDLLATANRQTVGTLGGEIGTSSLLNLASDDGLWPGPLGELRDVADVGPDSRWRSAWVTHLGALAKLATEAAKRIPPDVSGGRGNVFTDRYGSPKWRVADEAFSLFVGWDEGPYVVGGPLLKFAEGVLEFVSDGREKGKAIRPYLQEAANDAEEWWSARKKAANLGELLLNRKLFSRDQIAEMERDRAQAWRRMAMGSDRPRSLRARRQKTTSSTR